MAIIYYHGDAERTRRAILAGLGAIPNVDPAHPALAFLERASDDAFSARLRVSPRNAIMRDNRRGVLEQPVGDFNPWGAEESVFYMERKVWCDAVRLHNIERES